MKKHNLLRTNMLICSVIIIGFILTSVISYRSNIGIFRKNVESVTMLASEGVYHDINSIFSPPVNVSLTLANDSLLKEALSYELEHLDDQAYTDRMSEYLNAYKVKYGYDSVFLVSAETSRYYHFNGIDRVLTPDNPENVWYYEFIRKGQEMSLNVDNDEAADDMVTVFINCKVKDEDGRILGVIGVGLKVDSLQELLEGYNTRYGVNVCLVDHNGIIQISSSDSGYDQVNLFDTEVYSSHRDQILDHIGEPQLFWFTSGQNSGYIVSSYIDSLQWHLVIENNTSLMGRQIYLQFAAGVFIILVIIVLVLIIVTRVMSRYNVQLLKFTVASEMEYQNLLQEAAKGLYENVFELNITQDKAFGEGTRQYFESLGMNADTPYDQALRVIAKTQIKEEYVDGYLDIFAPANVLKVYESGMNTLTYDFLIKNQEEGYHWMRIMARIFFWNSDQSVHLISYRMNIDAEKKRELALVEQSQKDYMTGLYNKHSFQDLAGRLVQEAPDAGRLAFFILDIDNFKQINDTMGHKFGDMVIMEFAEVLKDHFTETDCIGRIGGDEFAVLIREYTDLAAVRNKLDRFFERLKKKKEWGSCDYTVTSSVGVSCFPEHGRTFSSLFEHADQALYYIKSHGKSYYQVFGEESLHNAQFQLDSRDLEILVNITTDGISKVAILDGNFKMLYFNASRADLTGSSTQVLSSPDYNVLDQIHPDDREKALEVLESAVPERRQFAMSFRMRHEDGHYFMVQLRGFFVEELYENQYPVFYAIYVK